MGDSTEHFRYRLGIDVGVASLGLAILKLDEAKDPETNEYVYQIHGGSGWGHMGLTATVKILEELKRDVVPARIAEDRAGLFHAMTPDGVLYDILPYYGEILIGHTVDPMWVSDYRLASDTPPKTNPLEMKYGRIPNPVVHLALRQIQKAVNAVIKKHGLPESIHIEVARDLNKSAEARDEWAKVNLRNQKASDDAREKIEALGVEPDRLKIQKYKLWKQQGGECIYSGDCIALTACATRGMVQRIQTEAARCEYEKLEDFVKNITPPFGNSKDFFNAAREATFERVTLSRKADHSTAGQLHEDTLLGIIDGPDKKGFYISRITKKISDYNNMAAIEKPKIKATMPDLPDIARARRDLEAIKQSLRNLCGQAAEELEGEQQVDIAAGKKGKKISCNAIYSRAVELHKSAGGKTAFTLYENRKLVNVRRAQGGNRPTGGYVSGRNHRKDFYIDATGKLQWQVISMLEANDKNFDPLAARPGHRLLWSAHKEDVLLMDDPDNPDRRIRVVVAKFDTPKMGVLAEADARASYERVMWEYGLAFFANGNTQRIVTDAIGYITYYFPMLPHGDKTKPRT